MPMTILAFGAHPDDIELQCAGTLALYARQGHRVFMAVATNGDMGNFDIEPEELARVREREFRASCAVIGAIPIWMGYPDELLQNSIENRLRFVDVLRQVDPDLVITHGPNDYHPDHRYTNQLVWDALPLAGVGNLKTSLPATRRQVALYFMDNLGGVNFAPTELVDITETIAIKKEMLSQHASQLRIFQELLGVDLLDMVETIAKFRGYQAGSCYAEGFTKIEAWYRGVSRRLLPTGSEESLFVYKTQQEKG